MTTIKSSTTTTTAYSVEADTTGALVIQTGVTPTTALTISSAQVVTLAQVLPEASGGTGTTTGYYGFKSRIINGGMTIDQRNAGAAITPTAGVYTLDRWEYAPTQASKLTIQQNAGSLSAANRPAGFINYLGITSTSSYSLLSGDYFTIRQNIEGLNVADLGWGTANASTVTLSFWVRSSLTGTHSGVIYNTDGTRSYVFSFTVVSASTWEQKTITIAGDTTGTWLTTNGVGIRVGFNLGTGSTYSGTAGSWSGTLVLAATGSVSVVSTNSATFYITGVQLEKGSTATSFDYRPYGTELLLCQRYASSTFPIGTAWAQNAGLAGCVIGSCSGTDTGYGMQVPWRFPVNMRATPTTITSYNPSAANANFRNLAVSANRTASLLGFGQNGATGICFTSGTLTDSVGMAYAIHYSVEAEL